MPLDRDSRLAAERYQLLVTNLPSSSVMLFDHDLRFVLADGPELEANGLSKAQVEGRLLHEAIDPDFAALVEPNLRAALGGRRFRAELPFGEQLYQYTYEPLLNPDGSVRYAMVVAQNVTALRQAERDARRAEALVQAVVSNLPAAVFAFGPDNRLRLAEGLGLARLGMTREQVLGRTAEELHRDPQGLTAHLAQARIGRSVSVHIPFGTMVWDVSFAPVFDAGGAVTDVVGMATEISDRLNAEASTRQSQKLEAVGQLAGGVAHDFNNMLAVVMSATEELRDALRDHPRLVELTDMVIGAAERSAQLTRQLLAFARSGPLSAEPVVVDDIVRDSAALLARGIDRRVQLDITLGAPGVAVVVDAAQLQTAVLNLGINARDAMPQGGHLTISTGVVHLDEDAVMALPEPVTPGSYAHITVTDTGIGIPRDVISRVFDPFFTTKEVGAGTGLGLAVVYGTARSHHGTVTVESAPGQGARFRLLLPVSERSTRPPASAPAPEHSGLGLILVVEDEPMVRTLAERLIQSLGYEVISAVDGPSGVARFRERHEALAMVLCDVVMPGMSGPDALRAMRAIDPEVPVALCSGYVSGHLDALDNAHAIELLPKPYRRDALSSLIARTARRLA